MALVSTPVLTSAAVLLLQKDYAHYRHMGIHGYAPRNI